MKKILLIFYQNKDIGQLLFQEKVILILNHGDLIACKNNKPFLIDCKTLDNKNGLFPLSRIEENQRLAYKKFKECGNNNYYLAILWDNDIYMLNMSFINFDLKSYDLKKESPKWRDFYDI